MRNINILFSLLAGVALNTWQSSSRDTGAVNIVKKHFNSVVAENCMKCQVISF